MSGSRTFPVILSRIPRWPFNKMIPVMLRYYKYRNLSFISKAAKLITEQHTRASLHGASIVKPNSALNKIDRLCHVQSFQTVLLNQHSRFRYLGTCRYGSPRTKTSVSLHFVYRRISSKPSDHNEKTSQEIAQQSPDAETQITVGAKGIWKYINNRHVIQTALVWLKY